MSRKRKADAVPQEEIVAEGSGPTVDVLAAAAEAVIRPPEPEPELDAASESEPDAAMESEPEPDAATESEPEPEASLPTSGATLDPHALRHLVEALIFAADKPVTLQRLRQLTRVSDVQRLEQALAELAEDYRDRGIALHQVSGGYQFRTNTQYSSFVQQLIAGRPVRLSRAQLETLAIIAYRQPITRPEIDDIRGVDSSGTLKVLLERALIRILGKKEEVGRPMLYGTTREFLDFFSLGDLRELPTLREYSELTAESRKVMSDRLGLAPDGEGDPPRADTDSDVNTDDNADAETDSEPTTQSVPEADGDTLAAVHEVELPPEAADATVLDPTEPPHDSE